MGRIIREIRLVGVTILVVALTGCVKDELHRTPHPDKGAVRVTSDWSGLSDDAAQPASYVLRIGETTQSVSGAENTFQHLLDEGSYTLLIHNTPRGVTVGNATATVETLPDGTLTPQPETLFSAMKALQVVKDDTLRVNAKMVQSLRALQLALKLNDGDSERIASTTATLTGIAHTIDLATGQASGTGTGKTVKPAFQPGSIASTRATVPSALIASLRLAGVASGERQVLTLWITLTEGTEVSIETDLTEALKDFGKEMKPLALNATLQLPDNPDAPTYPEVSGTITDWTEVDNGDITIH